MIVLDNEAVQALVVANHPKRRVMLAVVERALARRSADRAGRLSDRDVIAVPTVVRVEAGWDRRSATLGNHMGIRDLPLEGSENEAADLVAAHGASGMKGSLSSADAHLGSVLNNGDVVFTSDPSDVDWMAAHRNVAVRTVRV